MYELELLLKIGESYVNKENKAFSIGKTVWIKLFNLGSYNTS